MQGDLSSFGLAQSLSMYPFAISAMGEEYINNAL